jgi:hypothetical protein
MAVTLNASASAGLITTADTSTILQLQTGGTTAVSIGTDQSFNFSVTGQRITGDFTNATVANRVAFQTSTTNGATAISVIPNGTNNSTIISFSNASDPDNAAFNYVGTVSSEFRITGTKYGTGSYQPVVIQTGGSESLRLSATSKAVILAGGSTSANGTGITFPATQSASTDVNTLDDYEEGTFTPVVSYSGSTSGIVYGSARAGTYTKIGNVITVQLEVNLTNKGTGSGSVIVSLPFTNRAIRAGLAIGNTQGISANNSSYQAMVEVNLANVYFRVPSGLGSTTELGYADINNSFYVAMSGVYLIA